MIRQAKAEELDKLQDIFAKARAYMRENGNDAQWINGYPSNEQLLNDIARHHLYVIEAADGHLIGVFAFIIGEEPTYQSIEDGTWISETPYGTIHRLAGNGEGRGLFKECLDFCRARISHIRVDTHEKNKVMQALILKEGFSRRGIIYVEDGSPRIAYEIL